MAAAVFRRLPASTASGLLPAVGAYSPGGETPEDAQLVTAAAPSDYASSHTIVALGMGHSCDCPVLFRSTDGGATWSASTVAAPPASEQVALPPTYPADPRIFIGTNAQSGGAAYVLASFDSTPTPLVGPPGHIALAAGFDHGDNRVFVAAQGAVFTLMVDATPPTVEPILAYPQWAGTASVATPAGLGSAAVMVLAPPGTTAVSNLPAGETSAASVFACSAGTTCAVRGAAPPQARRLNASPSEGTSAAWWAQGVSVSRDGGQTFQTPPFAAPVVSVQSVAAVGARVWAIIQHGTTVALVWVSTAGGSWTDVTESDSGLSRSGAIVAIAGGPVLDLLRGRGLRCTTDGGLTWAARCP
jgi:hypothetical protein